MSVSAITWALAQHVGSSAAKFVLVVMADCADKESGIAFPSIAYIADATDQDPKTVKRALARLQEDGFITDTGTHRGRTKQIVVYRLNTTKNGPLSKIDESGPAESEAGRGSQGGALHDKNESPPNAAPFDSGTPPETDCFAASVDEVNPPKNGPLDQGKPPENGPLPDGKGPTFDGKGAQKRTTEPRANQDQNQQQRPCAGAPAREGGVEEEDQDPKPEPPTPFEQFFDAYPKQVERADCQRRWRVMDIDSLGETILADVRRRKLHDPEWLRGFVPNPRRYLDGRRWEDKPPGVAGAVAAVEAPKRNVFANPETPLESALGLIATRFNYELIDADERDRLIAEARAKFAEPGA